jgi:hypothetical protein
MAADIVDVSPQPSQPRVYLGDGLYAEFDGWQVRLFAHNGETCINEVFLEPRVLAAFLLYIESLKGGSVATR